MNVLGATISGGHVKRIAELAAALGHGPIPPDLRRERNHPVLWTSVISMALIALGIVFLMVEKPGWLGSAVTLVIALVVGVILAQMQISSDQTLAFMQDEGLTKAQVTTIPTDEAA
jgi:hypothetical protein